jgi:hypothetical protein
VKFSAFAYDPEADIVKRYGVFGMPTSYFIDRQGVITRVSTGQLNLRVMETAAQEALAGYDALAR